jgi:hypothetical protein
MGIPLNKKYMKLGEIKKLLGGIKKSDSPTTIIQS